MKPSLISLYTLESVCFLHLISGGCVTSPASDHGKKIQLFKMLSLTLVPILGLWAFCVYQLTGEVKAKQDHEKVSFLPVQMISWNE